MNYFRFRTDRLETETNERPNNKKDSSRKGEKSVSKLAIVSEDNSAKVYWTQWDSLVIENNILYRKWETPNLKSYILQIILEGELNKF